VASLCIASPVCPAGTLLALPPLDSEDSNLGFGYGQCEEQLDLRD